MNQILKDSVYGMGTQKQAKFMADIGGMNDEERTVFYMLHEKKSDLTIQEELGLSRKAFERIESSVRAKLLLAVFQCINYHMDEYNQ